MATALVLTAASHTASACSVIVQWQVPFQPQGTEISTQHIAGLAQWLGSFNRGPRAMEGVLVEGFAPAAAPGAKRLAAQRAARVGRMVQTFTGNTLPVAIHASVAAATEQDSNNDMAVVQLVPAGSPQPFDCPAPG
ncbi:hypothetical protein PGB34_20855 [Xenophilus arseniciresistens]|uniref:Uncharacterized protein n=1 Tax=Xenophilus arseniciresistens TaxID=1283306 RepID=A0AAE3NFR6_9BURK|nr:hypothetical protein [Xenophilus arseniciresistens]MDA7418829.1 hypothetical protein [Xenophilus arseniciresistens]